MALGTRSRSPTAAPRCVLSSPQTCKSLRPTGSRLRAPTAAPRGARASPHTSTSTCSRGSRLRAPTAAPRGTRLPPHTSTSTHPTGSCSSALTAAPRAAQHVDVSHGQPFARNTFNSTRFPPLAAASQRYSRCDRQPRRCRRFSALKHPRFAAQISVSFSNRSPVSATAARIPRLTAGSRARSAGSSKYSALRM